KLQSLGFPEDASDGRQTLLPTAPVIQKPEEGTISHEAGAAEGCELPDVGVGNKLWVLCKSSLYF
ncbi:hypothetical protein LEMLEM_LOCUS18703, partial [Lemmus lemmus]